MNESVRPRPRRRRPRWSLSQLLLVNVVIAVNIDFAARVFRDVGPWAWHFVLAVIGANLFICCVVGLIARLRPTSVLVMIMMAGLTEVVLFGKEDLWRWHIDWIEAVAILACVIITAFVWGAYRARRPHAR